MGRLLLLLTLIACSSWYEVLGQPSKKRDGKTSLLGNRLPPLDTLGENEGLPHGIGYVTKYGDQLIVISSLDGGRGLGTIGVLRPFNPNTALQFPPRSRITTLSYESAPSAVERKALRSLREPHGFGFFGSLAFLQAREGIQIWDFKNTRPQLVSEITVPGIGRGDYDGAWWITPVFPYVYVSAGSQGLYVLRFSSDLSAPASTIRIPIDQTGGFPVGATYAIGNRLVISGNRASGISVLDISTPHDPVLLSTAQTPVLYSGLLHGSAFLGAGADRNFYSFPVNLFSGAIGTADYSIPLEGQGGYLTASGSFAYVGASKQMVVIDLSLARAVRFGTSNTKDRDEDFASIIGPRVIVGDDHGKGATLFSHRPRDTDPPELLAFAPTPAPGEGVPEITPLSPLGAIFSEPIDPSSISEESIEVRNADGQVIPGTRSVSFGIVNFIANEPLAIGEYSFRIAAESISDLAGNTVPSKMEYRFLVRASVRRDSCSIQPDLAPLRVGTPASITLESSPVQDTAPQSYSLVAEGVALTSASLPLSWTPTESGRFTFHGTIRFADGSRSRCSRSLLVAPLDAPPSGNRSQSIALRRENSLLAYVVNDDNRSISLIDVDSGRLLAEITLDGQPSSVAVSPNGATWVTLRDKDLVLRYTSSLLDSNPQTIQLLYGSGPEGIVSSASTNDAFVALSGKRSIVHLSASGELLGEVPLEGIPRSLTLSPDELELFVPKFKSTLTDRSLVDGGVMAGIYVIPTTSFTGGISNNDEVSVNVIPLPSITGNDSESFSRGVLNYLFPVSISPSGALLAIPSKKDNIFRGLARDGKPLTFESTTRSAVTLVDRSSRAYLDSYDLDNRGLVTALEFDPTENLMYVVSHVTNSLETIRVGSGERLASSESIGAGPLSLLRDPQSNQLIVHDPLKRELLIFPVDGTGIPQAPSRISTVEKEVVPPSVREGRRVFTQASNRKMSRDGYISCASCHFDGDDDGMVWDFTDRGEGLRNTVPLRGRRGLFTGPLHWSGNFDEISDFEFDIRRFFGGGGFVPNALFPSQIPSAREISFSGSSDSLDALTEYIRTLEVPRRSPLRGESIRRGKQLFQKHQCGTCHSGVLGSDSTKGRRHHIGTLKASSGGGEDLRLNGFDTPALTGLWETEPYLHDGSAQSLDRAIVRHRLKSVPKSRRNVRAIARYLLSRE